jgi:hypothetical protein
MKLKDAEYNYDDVPQVPYDQVKLKWHSGYWDGPLSGLAEVNGQLVWFTFAEHGPDRRDEDDEDGYRWYRRHWLVQLTPEQLEYEQAKHATFQEYVGTHTEYTEEGKRTGEVNRRKDWQVYYEKYPPDNQPKYEQNEIIGWYEW